MHEELGDAQPGRPALGQDGVEVSRRFAHRKHEQAAGFATSAIRRQPVAASLDCVSESLLTSPGFDEMRRQTLNAADTDPPAKFPDPMEFDGARRLVTDGPLMPSSLQPEAQR